jgi:hypothetical protein
LAADFRVDLRADFFAADFRVNLRADFFAADFRVDLRADFFAADFRVDLRADFFAADFRVDLRADFFAADFFVDLFEADFFAGTFPPARRASDSPMAIACLRLVTFLPDLPLRNVPDLRSCIAFLTFDCAFAPYFAIVVPPRSLERPVRHPARRPSRKGYPSASNNQAQIVLSRGRSR